MNRPRLAWLLALAGGAATVLGFAPFGFYPLPLLTLALLAALLQHADRPRRGAALGFAFLLGLMLAGVSWIYVSLHYYGGMPAPLAALAVLLFAALLALYGALAGWLTVRLRRGHGGLDALVFAAAWTGAEWLRGWVLSGFPWLTVGYVHGPPSPLAGWAPLLGVYGLSFLTALLAALLGTGWRSARRLAWAGAAAAGVVLAGQGLGQLAWTVPSGRALSVSLLQGNIEQSLKWQPERLMESLQTYLALAESHPAELVVLPETALPLTLDQLPPDYLERLAATAGTKGGDVLFGIFTTEGGHYFNSAVSAGTSPQQVYRKSHLVAFGEFVPRGFRWVLNILHIPMSDQLPGGADQPPLAIAGEQVAVNICYEDVFGHEIIRPLPQATLLVNLTNTAWFGDSLAQPQHLQMAQMRALETGRPMLRATNTGMTAVIDAGGRVESALPPFTVGVLQAAVRGYSGLTPYARLGNYPALALVLLGLALGLLRPGRQPLGLGAPR